MVDFVHFGDRLKVRSIPYGVRLDAIFGPIRSRMEFGSLHRWVRVRLGSVQSAVLSIFGSVRYIWVTKLCPRKGKMKKKKKMIRLKLRLCVRGTNVKECLQHLKGFAPCAYQSKFSSSFICIVHLNQG